MEPDERDNPTAESGPASDPDGAAAQGSNAAHAKISRRRLILVDLLIGFTTVLLVVGMFSVYANRLLFSPKNWSNTSTQLLQDANVRSSTANYIVDQFYAKVDVASLLKSQLPPALQQFAAPAAGALRSAAVSGAETALTRPRVQDLWRSANYAAAQTFKTVVEGGNGAVKINNGAVTLDLSSIVDNVASRLGLPSNLSAKLPASIANLTVFKSNQLRYIQNGGNAIKGLALWLTILAPVLYALAIVLAAGHRRRTLMSVGFAAVFAGILVFFGRSLLQSQIPGALTNDATTQVTITHVVAISTGLLSEVAGAVTFVGVVLVLCGWFAGPAKPWVVTRRAMAPFLRERPVATYAITLAVMGLLFLWDPIPATGKPAGIIVFTVLALFGVEMLRRQTAREFPDARRGDATHAMRERWTQMRRGRGAAEPQSRGSSVDTTTQLQQLSDLRDRGALTPEEYQSAKSQLINGSSR
jgi:Short C-terminal domain